MLANDRELFRIGAIEVAELGIDRRERGNRMPLAEDEQILTRARRVGDVHVDEAAVVERDERDGCGERAAGVQALVDGITALLERQQPDVGVFDGEQLEDALTQEVIVRRARRAQRAPGLAGH